MSKLLVDVGSSTVKVYELSSDKVLKPLETKSIHYKNDFDPALGITEANKDTLITYINTLKERYNGTIKIYATAIFRKFEPEVKKKFIDEFFRKTGLFFNIVPHDLEGHYLEMALAGKYTSKEPLLLINIGGGSTELVISKGGEIVERHNLELGVMTVLKDFPHLNDVFSGHTLNEVVASIRERLPKTNYKTRIAMYNGGELTYMALAGYALNENTHFSDADHPSVITVANFAKRNAEIYEKVSLKQLEDLMPDDPFWMHGARPCSAIAQAVSEHFGAETIIPSDSNMVHGIVAEMS